MLPRLRRELQKLESEYLEELQTTLEVFAIEEFAAKLQKLAQACEAPSCLEYAQVLEKAAIDFNLDLLQKLLAEFNTMRSQYV